MLAGLGGTLIDADALARDATAKGEPTLVPIRARFGDGVFAADRSLDRAALARLVFDDPEALEDLESIVHPAVRTRVHRELARTARSAPRFVVIEAIKLVEGGLAERCDEVWLIDCSPAAQRSRLRQRGVEQSDAEQRLRAQGADLASRLAAALDGRVRWRRLPTEGSLVDVELAVGLALSEVLAAAGLE
jgi:dephospho-CoA kinase